MKPSKQNHNAVDTWSANPVLHIDVPLLFLHLGDDATLDEDEEDVINATWEAACVEGAMPNHVAWGQHVRHGQHHQHHHNVMNLNRRALRLRSEGERVCVHVFEGEKINAHAHTHTCRHTHTHTHTDTHADTHTHAQTDTQTHRHPQTHTYTSKTSAYPVNPVQGLVKDNVVEMEGKDGGGATGVAWAKVRVGWVGVGRNNVFEVNRDHIGVDKNVEAEVAGGRRAFGKPLDKVHQHEINNKDDAKAHAHEQQVPFHIQGDSNVCIKRLCVDGHRCARSAQSSRRGKKKRGENREENKDEEQEERRERG